MMAAEADNAVGTTVQLSHPAAAGLGVVVGFFWCYFAFVMLFMI